MKTRVTDEEGDGRKKKKKGRRRGECFGKCLHGETRENTGNL